MAWRPPDRCVMVRPMDARLHLHGLTFESLYVHFPFCETKCHYCDFYSLARHRTTTEQRLGFLQALQLEAQAWGPHLAPLKTLFMGGGTPSMTPAEEMEEALESVLPFITSETEWTMEANPSSIDLNLSDYRRLGANRLSIGVQSLRDDHLQWLGRAHDRRAALTALEQAFESGFEQVSVDLLCGVPGQTLKDLDHALETLCSYPITHLSCYLLTLPPHHRHYKDLPNEELQLGHLLHLYEQMKQRGFEHYETSNFAKPGGHARHNLRTWKGHAYLGLGPAAHSFSGTQRWKNHSSLKHYCSGEPLEWVEDLSPLQKQRERWMLGLRLGEGFPKNWLDPVDPRPQALMDQGLLKEGGQTYHLTPKGFAMSESVISYLCP